MAVKSVRRTNITLSGDLVCTYDFSTAENPASPGQVEIRDLASGANTITPPAGGTTPRGVTIIPPSGNTVSITLKGVTGDTGVALHKTDQTTIALDSPTATFVLTAGAVLTGLRLVWS